MNITYTNNINWILAAALFITSVPFLVGYFREARVRSQSPSQNKNGRSTVLAIAGLILGVTVNFATLMPASAQELFVLSTDSGLELYQIDTVNKPNFAQYRNESALWPKTAPSLTVAQSLLTPMAINNTPILSSGFVTTETGRIATVAGRIAWQYTQPQLEFVKELPTPPAPETPLVQSQPQRMVLQDNLGSSHLISN
ncbi:MAG: hypothetical protein VST68_11625 [Nitrospirota bacterium]|nr:hypothetical protein [Nitrospirota bacterium]